MSLAVHVWITLLCTPICLYAYALFARFFVSPANFEQLFNFDGVFGKVLVISPIFIGLHQSVFFLICSLQANQVDS